MVAPPSTQGAAFHRSCSGRGRGRGLLFLAERARANPLPGLRCRAVVVPSALRTPKVADPGGFAGLAIEDTGYNSFLALARACREDAWVLDRGRRWTDPSSLRLTRRPNNNNNNNNNNNSNNNNFVPSSM